jgi:hypothetical protein
MPMTATRVRLPRLRLTLRQMMKLVIIAAFASAAVAPIARLKDQGGTPSWWTVVVWAAVVAPLVSALVAFPLVRKGSLKDWLIRALLTVSVAVAFGLAIFFLVWQVRFAISRRISPDYHFLLPTGAVAILLGFAVTLLVSRVIPRWCPDCYSPMLIPDVPARAQPGLARAKVYRCLGCKGHYQKVNGVWEPFVLGFPP